MTLMTDKVTLEYQTPGGKTGKVRTRTDDWDACVRTWEKYNPGSVVVAIYGGWS